MHGRRITRKDYQFFLYSCILIQVDESREIKQMARTINVRLERPEREIVLIWLKKLLEIRDSRLSKSEKIKAALTATKESRVTVSILKIIGAEAKRIGWDERSWAFRLFASGALIGLGWFGGESAGIAAFGTAYAVPIWLVLAGGSALPGILIDEIQGYSRTPK
ncbi:MAG TPA: hypothetical protein VN610_10790 [Bryobacteraceae bacterium]|nr:hypothetical protein [Bryobacteraceae bacterium]